MPHTAMKRFVVRPAQANDLEAVAKLIAKQQAADFGQVLRTTEDLRKLWDHMDLELQTCTAYSDGHLAGYAELLNGDEPYIYLMERGNVDLAFQLLKIMEDIALAHSNGSVKLMTKISENNKPLLQLFASNGYRSDLSFMMMETELKSSPPQPHWPDGLSVRPFVVGQDEMATYQADEEAGEDKGYHTPLDYESWRARMRMDQDAFDPGLWFLATDGQEIAGVALNYYDAATEIGWVDHLSVRRGWRRKGVGRALLLHSFGAFYERGIQRVKLNVDSKSLTNAPLLYNQVGMQKVNQYHVYTKII